MSLQKYNKKYIFFGSYSKTIEAEYPDCDFFKWKTNVWFVTYITVMKNKLAAS